MHGIGKRSASEGKPRQIVARLLRYPDREEVTSNAKKLKGKELGISAHYPEVLVERRRKKAKEHRNSAILTGKSQTNICVLRLTLLIFGGSDKSKR